MEWEAWRIGVDVFQIGLMVAVGIYAWQSSRHKATRRVTDDHEKRLVRVEAQLESVPSVETLHDLALATTSLGGEVKALAARLQGLEDVVKRVEIIVNRQEEHLLAEARRER